MQDNTLPYPAPHLPAPLVSEIKRLPNPPRRAPCFSSAANRLLDMGEHGRICLRLRVMLFEQKQKNHRFYGGS
jgi:hypothetical protein